MTKLRWFLATAMVLLFAAGEAQAQEINEEQKADSTQQDTTGMKLQVTLVTCDPGPDAYQMFGHTAIRIKDLNNPDYDLVYNYGVFDSRRDNFIYYFVKGETDYVLSVDPARLFLDRYTHRFGIPMREQFLNINDQEKLELTKLLEINAHPDNRTYRYNFLYDNCTTRATNIIEKALEKCGVQLKYETKSKEYEKTTFRQVLHRFTAVAPWTEFGIDFVLGAEVDKPRSQREQMFIPSVYEAELDKAQMVGQDGKPVKMVAMKRNIEPMVEMAKTPDFPLSPFATFSVVLLFVIIMAFVDIRRKKLSIWMDIAGFFIRGLAGFLVAFLFFFSEHPAVGSNWLVLAFNPIVFIMIPDVIFAVWQKRFMAELTIRGKRYDWFELVNLAVLVFTLLLFVLPLQTLNIAMLPLVLILLIRSLTRIVVLTRNNLKNEQASFGQIV